MKTANPQTPPPRSQTTIPSPLPAIFKTKPTKPHPTPTKQKNSPRRTLASSGSASASHPLRNGSAHPPSARAQHPPTHPQSLTPPPAPDMLSHDPLIRFKVNPALIPATLRNWRINPYVHPVHHCQNRTPQRSLERRRSRQALRQPVSPAPLPFQPARRRPPHHQLRRRQHQLQVRNARPLHRPQYPHHGRQRLRRRHRLH